jgi:hypothetical protein
MTMRSLETVLGMLFSGAMVRLASIGIACYVGLTIGGEVIETLNGVTAAFQVLPR